MFHVRSTTSLTDISRFSHPLSHPRSLQTISAPLNPKCFPYLCVKMVFWISVLNIGVWASNVWRLRLGQMWLNYDIITHQIDFIQYARKLWMARDKLNIYSALQNWQYWMLQSNLSAVQPCINQSSVWKCLHIYSEMVSGHHHQYWLQCLHWHVAGTRCIFNTHQLLLPQQNFHNKSTQ